MYRLTDDYFIGRMTDYDKEKEIIEFFDKGLKAEFSPVLQVEELLISETVNNVSVRISYPIEIKDAYREMKSDIDQEIVRLRRECKYLF